MHCVQNRDNKNNFGHFSVSFLRVGSCISELRVIILPRTQFLYYYYPELGCLDPRCCVFIIYLITRIMCGKSNGKTTITKFHFKFLFLMQSLLLIFPLI